MRLQIFFRISAENDNIFYIGHRLTVSIIRSLGRPHPIPFQQKYVWNSTKS